MLKNVIRSKKEKTNPWMPQVITGKGPKYLQIVASMEEAIANGSLRPGDVLPAQRQLATLLNIDLTTVTRAYTEARERYLIQTRSGKGTFITDPESRLAGTIDLSMNIPPSPDGVLLDHIIQQNMKMLLDFYDSHALTTYHNTGGNKITRQVAAEWLKPILPHADIQRIAMSPGAQSAISAVLLMLTNPGDAIMVEPYTYPGLLLALHHLQRKAYTIEVDEEGPSIASILHAIQQGVRVLYLNPTINNPTTKTISQQRRQEIAQVLNQHHIHLIEDDPYYLLAEDAPSPIACLAPEYTYYISTLSKVLTPGFQIAYNVFPHELACQTFCETLRSLSIMASPLMSALTTYLIRSGQAFDMLNGVRKEAHQRLLMAKSILHLPDDTPQNSIHVWYPLPKRLALDQFMSIAQTHNLGIMPSTYFTAENDRKNEAAVRVSLGAIGSRSHLAMALHTLHMLSHKE